MRILATITALFLSQAQGNGIAIASGVAAENLADTPVTDSINMEASRPTNQLSLTLSVTPGTSATVNVYCEESLDGTTWSRISLCDNATPSTCKPELRTYTFADYAGATKVIASRWPIAKKYARCSTDDPLDGTGTITITGTRSWR
jgi:hypothetical protein